MWLASSTCRLMQLPATFIRFCILCCSVSSYSTYLFAHILYDDDANKEYLRHAAGTVTGQALLWSLPNRDCLLELRCDSKILRSTPINRIVWSPEGNWFGASCQPCLEGVGRFPISSLVVFPDCNA